MAAGRITLALALLLSIAPVAQAETDRILDFVSDVEIKPDSRLDVVETITLRVSEWPIRKGFDRDFPTDDRGLWGLSSPTGFTLEDVTLDGESVPTQLSQLKNEPDIWIADPDRPLAAGIHTYTIRYLTWWRVSFGSDEDSLDWNVIGSGWHEPIDRAEFRLHGPEGLVWSSVRLSTGRPGSRTEDARIIREAPGFLDVVTTRPLSPYQGLTVAASFPKGVLQQPSQLAVATHYVDDNLALMLSFLGVICIGFYVGWLFLYGAARPRGVIVPQFAPPRGFSPAMVGYLMHKRVSDRDFRAAIVGLAVARRLKLIYDGTYRLVRQPGGEPVTGLEAQFENRLFSAGDELSISATYNKHIDETREALERFLCHALMPKLLYKELRNVWPAVTIAAATIVLTVAALAIKEPALIWRYTGPPAFDTHGHRIGGGHESVVMLAIGLPIFGALLLLPLLRGVAILQGGTRSRIAASLIGGPAPLTFLSLGLLLAAKAGLFLVALFLVVTAVLAGASFFRLTVPTAEGWKRRNEIAGLKLFLGVAAADRLRVVNPPDFTPALYEKLLPYAIVLGVDHMVWSRRFGVTLTASEHQPVWHDGADPGNGSDVSSFSYALGRGFAAAIATASRRRGWRSRRLGQLAPPV
jgi:Predicted membrane protein (DUF2207) C-terminal domain/Predicted membrane protein (DUF2207) N-terminal domain